MVALIVTIIVFLFSGFWTYFNLELQQKPYRGTSVDRKDSMPSFYISTITFWGLTYSLISLKMFKSLETLECFKIWFVLVLFYLVVLVLSAPQHTKWKQKVRDFNVAKNTAMLFQKEKN